MFTILESSRNELHLSVLEVLRISKFQHALRIVKKFYTLLLFYTLHIILHFILHIAHYFTHYTTALNPTNPNFVREENHIIRTYLYSLRRFLLFSALFSSYSAIFLDNHNPMSISSPPHIYHGIFLTRF